MSDKAWELSLWPGIIDLSVEYERSMIDVTTFADASPKYVGGPTTCLFRIHCDQDAGMRAPRSAPEVAAVRRGQAAAVVAARGAAGAADRRGGAAGMIWRARILWRRAAMRLREWRRR